MKKMKCLMIIMIFSVLTLWGYPCSSDFFPTATIDHYTGHCSSTAALPGLDQTTDENLAKLKEYQEVCGSYVTDSLMIFTDMPKDETDAVKMAQEMAGKLKEFSRYKIKPIVIVEPQTNVGLVNFKEFRSGFYDPFLEIYFQTLKNARLTDDQLGTWVPFPEANLSHWNRHHSRPEDFGIIVNKYLGMLKKYFPAARGSILLDSSTYDFDDFKGTHGKYLSLLPYVRQLNPRLIDSFGLQGFPWMPEKGSKAKPVHNPAEFLCSQLADEAATFLGIKKIWFNTGTFGKKYTNHPELTVFTGPKLRKHILTHIVEEALKLKKMGYQMSINLFAENKSSTEEATDWTYWQTPGENNPNKEVFRDFMKTAAANGIPVSLFDRKPDDAAEH
jgi:hypothetical protein